LRFSFCAKTSIIL